MAPRQKKKTKEQSSSEFKERKKLIELQTISDEGRHKFKMKELEFARESERINHEHSLTRGRIKNAEIKKFQERKEK